ncbi:ORF22 [Lymantria xylina nucleopolyhedrovirus]|uniref:ORF22 n=1 Tax=Lymantria xylina multiple nucleopolyhedrovirus TaxID=2847840 RepID=D4N259_9ABAC|nr:ORF22 [Lymantria xylina nucleopolyhedrovirus]ADD73731.1 ORF22 [Lymantria xylina nucleopolyhedrovirus]
MKVYLAGNLYNFNNYLKMISNQLRLSDYHVFGLVFEKEYRDIKEVNRKFTVTKHEMVYARGPRPTASSYAITDPSLQEKIKCACLTVDYENKKYTYVNECKSCDGRGCVGCLPKRKLVQDFINYVSRHHADGRIDRNFTVYIYERNRFGRVCKYC